MKQNVGRLNKCKRVLALALSIAILTLPELYLATDAANNSCRPTEESVPEAFKEYGIKLNSYEKRLKHNETDLDTIIYQETDGKEVAYIFSENVKFVDDDGITKDKSNVLYEVTDGKFDGKYSYVNKNNDIKTFFPDRLGDDSGILLNYNGMSIETIPVSKCTGKTELNNDTLVYDNAFENDAKLEYRTTFSGFKENIIINDGSINTFSFIVKCPDIRLEEAYDHVDIVDEKTNLVTGKIDPIYVYDSFEGEVNDGEIHDTYLNQMSVEETAEGVYNLTITVDPEFLSSSDTVYPVYIDPSYTLGASGSGTSKTILDTTMYNGPNVSSVPFGGISSSYVGYHNSAYGTGRMLMRFPGLMSKSFMGSAYTVYAARVGLSESSGSSVISRISCCEYTGPDWNESTTYYQNIWNGVGSLLSRMSFSYPDHTSRQFTITDAVRKWKENPSTASKGIIFNNYTSETDGTKCKTINTVESSSKPYLIVYYFYNGAKPVYQVNSSPQNPGVNCHGYAFFLNDTDSFNEFTIADRIYCQSNSLSDALSRTEERLVSNLTSRFGQQNVAWRTLSSYYDPLSSDEWLVCMRVGKGASTGSGNQTDFGYHFWYRANDGNWYNKHGSYSSEIVDEDMTVIDPSTAYGCDGWAWGEHENYYSSEIRYYAVKV